MAPTLTRAYVPLGNRPRKISAACHGNPELMYPLDVVKLTTLMQITRGRPEIVIGLLDGPVAVDHPDLTAEHIRELPGRQRGTRPQANIAARIHGTFVAGMLCAKRGSAAPAICPDCTLLVRPIFRGTTAEPG